MRPLKFLRASLLLLAFVVVQGQAQTASVAVAANMKDAFTEIEVAFRATGKPPLRVIYGSSGNFTAQIMNGAPFSLFVSADEQFPLELYKSGKTIDEGRVYAVGRIALLTKNNSGLKLGNNTADLARVIVSANKVAIAKPELAPYGKAAVEYLKAAGLWELAKEKLVYADNVSVAAMYVLSGAADLGFTALSLARSPEIAKDANYITVDDALYKPIRQRVVLMKGAPKEALDLYVFLQSAVAKNILIKNGYMVP
jgi:molybdate transport system substrate-binding protein